MLKRINIRSCARGGSSFSSSSTSSVVAGVVVPIAIFVDVYVPSSTATIALSTLAIKGSSTIGIDNSSSITGSGGVVAV
jgi:hypothetical protein